MTKKRLAIGLVTAALLSAGGYGLYQLGKREGMTLSGTVAANAESVTAATKAGELDLATGRKVLYWHDPMVPGQKFDKPGKSPFMDMMLVPVYADGDADQGNVTISPRVQQNLGVRIAEVTRSTLTPRVEAAGTIVYNERDQAIVQARATGYIERLYVRATLDRVGKGQALADLYVPDWVAAQEEFLSVRRMQGTDLAALVDGARQRMRQAGMSDEQIHAVETSGKVQPRIMLTAPLGGVVVELMAREGMTVMPGATLFRISGLSTVWANADVPESQSALLRPGAAVEARSPALPGGVFKGKVQAILPEVNPTTRTIKARIELANPGAKLIPGMFVSVGLSGATAEALAVPTEAVIQTGKRMVVMLAEVDGKFRPVEVEIGTESNGLTEIKRGLEAGQKVAVSGQFLVDSEASLKGVITRMGEVPDTSRTAPQYEGEARIVTVDSFSALLEHGPIPALKWGAMTMEFMAPTTGMPKGLKPGQSVRFAFTMDKNGQQVLTRIEPVERGGVGKKP